MESSDVSKEHSKVAQIRTLGLHGAAGHWIVSGFVDQAKEI